jgi:hypothetical protein
MQLLEYPLWMVQQALSALSYFWPITLVLVVPFVATLALKSPFISSKAKLCPRHLSVFLPLAATGLILIWGTVMAHSGVSLSLWPGHVVQALLILQFIASIWAVWLMKGYRLFSTFAVTLELWFALACAFIAYMSVTGDWL